MSEVNYRRNGMKYSSFGHHKPQVAYAAKAVDTGLAAAQPKPKSSRERRAMKKGK